MTTSTTTLGQLIESDSAGRFFTPAVLRKISLGSIILSFFTLRLAQVGDLDVNFVTAYKLGLVSGLLSDLGVVLLALGLGRVMGGLFRLLTKKDCVRVCHSIFLIPFFSLTLVNACYFLFFKRSLTLGAFLPGLGTAWAIRSGALESLERPLILISLILFSSGLIGFLWTLKREQARKPFSHFRLIGLGLVFFVMAIAMKQAPIWARIPRMKESGLSKNVVWRFWKQWKTGKWRSGFRESELKQILPESPGFILRYTKMNSDFFPSNLSQMKLAYQSSHVRQFEPDLQHSRWLRREFGLPVAKKPNVILLFLESVRAYEFINPKIGSEIFPNLRKVVNENGWFFKETYSTANVTVEGQFATLCSAMDRMNGPPTYSHAPYLGIECLQGVLGKNGYRTYWMNPYYREFSGKYAFESVHGTQNFLDQSFFKARADQDFKNSSEWGISDAAFLDQAIEELEKIHDSKQPFFAHLLTTGTHFPWRKLEGFDLSAELESWTKVEPSYQGYLSAEKALDQALGKFFERFFRSRLSDDTMVVVLSDHGTGVNSPDPQLSALQKSLLWPRIIFSVISKEIKDPHRISYPVHQLDVAPFIATLTGSSGKVGWLGRDPTLGTGTPWVKLMNNRLFYRTSGQICAQLQNSIHIECWNLASGVDPLLASGMPKKSEDGSLSEALRSVIKADEALIESGNFVPRENLTHYETSTQSQ